MYGSERRQLPLPQHLNYTTSRHVGINEGDRVDVRDRTRKTYKKDAPDENERETVFLRPFAKTLEYAEILEPTTDAWFKTLMRSSNSIAKRQFHTNIPGLETRRPL